MAHASEKVSDCDILIKRPRLTFKEGPFSYQIARQGEHSGALYEGRVSFFREPGNLNITILHPRSVPKSLEDALGRRMSQEAARGCFNCHSTAAVSRSQLQLDHLVPGVTCEACHGPGEKHLGAVKAKNFNDLQIFNPRTLDSFDLTQEFCGACHMSFEQAMAMPDHGGIKNLR